MPAGTLTPEGDQDTGVQQLKKFWRETQSVRVGGTHRVRRSGEETGAAEAVSPAKTQAGLGTGTNPSQGQFPPPHPLPHLFQDSPG